MSDKEKWDIALDLVKFALTFLTSGVAGIWALVKWRQDREKDRAIKEADLERREKERRSAADRVAALYVNPFLQAIDALQSRLYNILENGGLVPLRARSDSRRYAPETVLLLARLLLWQDVNFRHGPYARMGEVVRLCDRIVEVLASDKAEYGGLSPFCFFRTEQSELLELVRLRVDGPFGPEFDSISFAEFLQQTPPGRMPAVDRAIEDLRSANTADDLLARSRLTALQWALVDLIEYVEDLERFKLRETDRKRARSTTPRVLEGEQTQSGSNVA